MQLISVFLLSDLIMKTQELTKFINKCNETKAATLAEKDGGPLRIAKPSAPSSKKE